MNKAAQFIRLLLLSKLEGKSKALPLISIAAATTLLYALSQYNSNKKPKEKFKKIPVPGSAYPYVGHILSLGEFPGNVISQWHKDLGPIIKLHMGIQTWILVDEPNLAHKIFVSHGADSSLRPHSLYGSYHVRSEGKGFMFAQPGSALKELRIAALSVLAPKQIEKYMDSIHRESTDLVSRLIEFTEKEGGTNPKKCLELNFLNIICLASFGIRFDSIKDPGFVKLTGIVDSVAKFAGIENDLANFLPIVSILDYFAGTNEKMKTFVRDERDPFYKQLIEEAANRDGPSLIKSLEENGFNLSVNEKIVFMSDMILGSTDTVSVTMSWTIAIMCHYPEVQRKVSAEIDEFIRLNGRLPLFTERKQLPYCISVMKECLRYRPISPFGLPHAVHNDLEVDGYFIPKGATVITNMGSMHKRAEFYSDPESFLPERFMNNLKTMSASANGKIEERDHFNFGWGRRICPGIYLAEVEIYCAFVQLFARCFIEPIADGLPDIHGSKNAGLVLLPLPYKVKFTKRTDSLI